MKTRSDKMSKARRLAGYTAITAGVCATTIDADADLQVQSFGGAALALGGGVTSFDPGGGIRLRGPFPLGDPGSRYLQSTSGAVLGGGASYADFFTGAGNAVMPAFSTAIVGYFDAGATPDYGAAFNVPNYVAVNTGGVNGWLKFNPGAAAANDVTLDWFVYEDGLNSPSTLTPDLDTARAAAAAIPEPSSLLLFACGLLGIARRRRSKASRLKA